MEKPYFNCQVLVTTSAQAAMKNSLDSSYQEFCIFSNSNLLHNTNVKELDTYKKPSSISKNSTYVNLITHDEEAQLKTSILNDTQFNLLNTTQLLFLKTENQIYLRLKENITDIFSYTSRLSATARSGCSALWVVWPQHCWFPRSPISTIIIVARC